MEMILDDQVLDELASEYHNSYTNWGTPLYNVMSFETYVNQKVSEQVKSRSALVVI